MRTATMLLAVVVVLVPGCATALVQPHEAADFEAGAEAYLRGDYATALKEWRPLAEQGDAAAQLNLGFMYRLGQGVPQDYKEALRWFRLAAAQGVAMAQHHLGWKYETGEGVPQDDTEAVQWYRLAAAQGWAMGQNSLGVMYENGRGVPQDDVQALMWFNLAAAQGNQHARKARDIVAKKMTPAQLAKAQRLARKWKPK